MSAPSALPLADDAARRLAREQFDVPVLLEAGAGTGKTRALIERLLAWTLDLGWHEVEARQAERALAATPESIAGELLDGVVAITFTEAAAAEMAARLGTALAKLAGGEIPEDARSVVEVVGPESARPRAVALGAELGRARIQTIHAFGRALLAAHPFDAGLHPTFEVDAEGDALDRVAFEVVSARLAGALVSADSDWILLLNDDHSPQEILDALLEAVREGVTALELEADPFPRERIEELRASAPATLAPLLAALGSFVAKGKNANNRAFRVEPWLRHLASELADCEIPLERIAAELRESEHPAQLRTWAKGDSVSTIEKSSPEGAEPLAHSADRAARLLARVATFDPVRMGRARRLLASLLAETRERLRHSGHVQFEELLTRSARLLRERPDVRATVRSGIRQLLVDEFQDTDRRQCELVTLLALDGARATRPGLFVVGDPKQSIYGWRNADLASYEAFLETADAEGAIRGRLAVNFRSIPAILAEVERVIAPEMLPEAGHQPAFESLLPSPKNIERGEARGDLPSIELWWSAGEAGDKTTVGAANAFEAHALAADIREQRRRDATLKLSDIAVLFRTSSDLETYLRPLRESGIEFAVERDRSYWHRREIVDAAATVRAVLDPGDHLALVTLLRSPFVGVPDAALPLLWRERFPDRLDRLTAPDPATLDGLRETLDRAAAAIPRDVPGISRVAGWEASAYAAIEALAELRQAFGAEAADRFVERLRARLAPEPVAAARFLGRYGVANLERFFRELEAQLVEEGGNPVALARFLRRAVSERPEAREARPPANEGDAVRIMTIHAAKGLEFRQVYLLQLHKEPRGWGSKHPFELLRATDGRFAFRLLDCRSLDWPELDERRQTRADRERLRLLYVAMTRAKERLVLAGQFKISRGSAASFLPYLERRFTASPFASGVRLPREAEPELDAYGARWRIPALEPGAGVSEPRPESVPEVDDPAALARDLDELTTRRTGAQTRSARPRFLRASQLEAFEPDTDPENPASIGSPGIDTDPFQLRRELGRDSLPWQRNEAKGKSSLKGRDEERNRGKALDGSRTRESDPATLDLPTSGAPQSNRALSLARGVALHRALELQPLALQDDDAWRQIARAAFVAARRSGTDATELADLEDELANLKSSLLWKQLSIVSVDPSRVVARELPLLLSANRAHLDPGAPTDGYVGTLDLLYRDPETDEIVVADFKSDLVNDDVELPDVVERYRPQLELYGRAVREGLGLAAPPRLELWLIALDRIQVVS